MGGRRNAETSRAFGLGLAQMHSAPAPDWPDNAFGFPLDGSCGAMSQPNQPSGDATGECLVQTREERERTEQPKQPEQPEYYDAKSFILEFLSAITVSPV